MDNFDIINKTLLQNNIVLESSCINKLEKFYQQLIKYNKVMNLTAITDIYEVSLKHFTDSLFHVKHYKSNSTIIDIGSGAGFPGIPIAIARPDINITLVDSLNKRVEFLNTVINELELKNVTAIHSRAQEYCTTEHRERFDYSIARAVAPLNILSELCIPFVKISGEFIAYKSLNIDNEIESAKHAIIELGGEISKINYYTYNTSLINSEYPKNKTYFDKITRSIIEIKKISITKTIYPRLKNLITSKPL